MVNISFVKINVRSIKMIFETSSLKVIYTSIIIIYLGISIWAILIIINNLIRRMMTKVIRPIIGIITKVIVIMTNI